MIIRIPSEKEADRSHRVRLFDIAEFSGYDGPGIRTVVYFQGCRAACDWCHSPHSQPTVAPLMFNEIICQRCGRCVSACKQKVHEIVNEKHLLHRDRCMRCGSCIGQCPASTRGVAGSALHLPTVETTVETLFEQILPYLELNKDNGGITLSGGEALLQLEAAKTLLRLCKEKGIHTTVETSGLLSLQSYYEVLPLVDLWLFGMRVITDSTKEYLRKVDAALELLTHNKAKLLPRIPMVPGYFDREDVLCNVIYLLQKYSLRAVWLNPWNIDYDIHYYQAGLPLLMENPTSDEIEMCREKILLTFNNFNITMYENNNKQGDDSQSEETL